MSERVPLDWPLRSWMLTSMSKKEYKASFLLELASTITKREPGPSMGRHEILFIRDELKGQLST